jgi:hypothetical protein
VSTAVVCMAFGANARAEAATLADNLAGYGLPLTIVGDAPVRGARWRKWEGDDPFDRADKSSHPFRAGRVKPFLHEYIDADRCLYLDTDSAVVGDVARGFALLDEYDFAIADHGGPLAQHCHSSPGQAWYHGPEERALTVREWGTGAVPFWNSGVIFWRAGEAATRIFRAWSEEWLRFGEWDEQMALMRAVRANPCRLLVLPVGWNAPHREHAVVIHHWYSKCTSRAKDTTP